MRPARIMVKELVEALEVYGGDGPFAREFIDEGRAWLAEYPQVAKVLSWRHIAHPLEIEASGSREGVEARVLVELYAQAAKSRLAPDGKPDITWDVCGDIYGPHERLTVSVECLPL